MPTLILLSFFAADAVGLFVETLKDNPYLARIIMTVIPAVLHLALPVYARLFGSPMMRGNLVRFLERYTGQLVSSEKTLVEYVRFPLVSTTLSPSIAINFP